jgi:excisionase family DNA binding protein
MKDGDMKPENLETQEIRSRSEPAPGAPELFTASQFALLCHVDLKTIHNWADRGEVRHFRTPGRHLRFRRADVVEFLRKFGYPVPEILRAGKPKVVAVDDDPHVLASIRRALGRRFEVTTFQDAFDALVAIGKLEPDAIVIDVQLRGLDGMRCLERLRAIEATSRIRTIVFSSQHDKRRAALDAGANDFVPKGDVALLRESIERLTGVERG